MSGGSKKCAFLSCTSSQPKDGLRFFKFPVRNPEVCDRWVINCANSQLIDLPLSALRSRVVCEKHFEPLCFNNPSKSSKLRKDAVPTLFIQDTEVHPDLGVHQTVPRTTSASTTTDDPDSQPPLSWIDRQRQMHVGAGPSSLALQPPPQLPLPGQSPFLPTSPPQSSSPLSQQPQFLPPPPTSLAKRMKLCSMTESAPTAVHTPVTRSKLISHASPDTPRKIKLKKDYLKANVNFTKFLKSPGDKS